MLHNRRYFYILSPFRFVISLSIRTDYNVQKTEHAKWAPCFGILKGLHPRMVHRNCIYLTVYFD
uniref:Uncharacterized protein n=1 Tax=Anopheles atroparvus TaxID=41427 RepID=A0AAG5DHB6_ANOAO